MQYRKVPEEINNEIQDVHLEPYYKIFTRILADKKNEEETQQCSSLCLSSTSFTNSDIPKLFNDKCFLCKKGRVERNNREIFPVTIETDEAVEFFLAATKQRTQCTKSSSCSTYTQKNLNGTNIAIVISQGVTLQGVAEICK